jgi:hypothetical protein
LAPALLQVQRGVRMPAVCLKRRQLDGLGVFAEANLIKGQEVRIAAHCAALRRFSGFLQAIFVPSSLALTSDGIVTGWARTMPAFAESIVKANLKPM